MDFENKDLQRKVLQLIALIVTFEFHSKVNAPRLKLNWNEGNQLYSKTKIGKKTLMNDIELFIDLL